MVELITSLESGILARLVELETEAFGPGGMNEWHLVPFIRHGKVFIYKKQGTIVGEVQYMRDWHTPNLAYLTGVCVAAEVRGAGIGTELLVRSMAQLFAEDITEVELTVEANNEAAIRVYKEKLGFVVASFRKDEYGPGKDRVIMRLTSEQFKKFVS